jgi:hypothetical protein
MTTQDQKGICLKVEYQFSSDFPLTQPCHVLLIQNIHKMDVAAVFVALSSFLSLPYLQKTCIILVNTTWLFQILRKPCVPFTQRNKNLMMAQVKLTFPDGRENSDGRAVGSDRLLCRLLEVLLLRLYKNTHTQRKKSYFYPVFEQSNSIFNINNIPAAS